jgi:hypothetical protein
MKNVKASIDQNGILTLTIDTKLRLGKSASGKTETVATTAGNKGADAIEGLPAGLFVGLNVYAK